MEIALIVLAVWLTPSLLLLVLMTWRWHTEAEARAYVADLFGDPESVPGWWVTPAGDRRGLEVER